jgi:hypothetical protein
MDASRPALERVFTRAEKRATGMSRREFEAAVDAKAIIKLRRTVFADAGTVTEAARHPATAHALEIEALLRALSRERIAAAASSAGILHGLEFVVPPAKELVVCTSDPGVKGTRLAGYLLRPAPLPDDHVEVRHHVPVTTVARTLFDLASDLPFPHALATTDHARHHHLASKAELDAMLEWGAGRAGVDAARKVFGLSDPRAESALESISRAGMHEENVPMPELQVEIFNPDGEFVARVDFLWQLPVIGDPSGWKRFRRPGTNDVPLAVVKQYFARKHALIDLGFEFLTWTWDEAANDPPVVANRIFAALERAEARVAAAARRARSRA